MAKIDKIKVGSTTYSILDSVTAQIVCDNEESGNTASRTYTKGEYVKINDKLYKVTANIATGQAMTVGVNITETNVGDELSQLKSDLGGGFIVLTGTVQVGTNYLTTPGGVDLTNYMIITADYLDTSNTGYPQYRDITKIGVQPWINITSNEVNLFGTSSLDQSKIGMTARCLLKKIN